MFSRDRLVELCLAILLAPASAVHAADKPAPAKPAASKPQASTEADCEAQWRRFFRSQACFERFRNVGGSIKGQAIDQCGQPLPDPTPQCSPPTQPR